MDNENLQKLIKPLRLELKKGCLDKAASGGLAAYVRKWAGLNQPQAPLGPALEALAAGYEADTPPQRKAAIEKILHSLQVPESTSPNLKMSPPASAPRPASLALDPASPAALLPGIGLKRSSALRQLGIESVEDLLYHFPREWQDRSRLIPIIQARAGEHVTLCGTVRGAANFRTRGRMAITEVGVQDDSGIIFAMYFNQPFRQRQFVVGATVFLSGRVELRGSRLQIMNPEAEVLPEGEERLVHTGRVVPIYPLAKEISQRVLRKAIWDCLDATQAIVDPLPLALREELKLGALAPALRQIHFPDSEEQRLAARERLVFDEFFTVGLGMALRKARRKKEPGAVFSGQGSLQGKLLASLPFKLTRAQLRVWSEIEKDLRRGEPMQRLVQGDVGSGKTLVAALALADCIESGYQGAMMAPTEILAEQHLLNLRRWFEPLGIEVVPLKQGQRAAGRKQVLNQLQTGQSLIAVGTQALIQEGVEFGNLGLAVVDEQHRFGVLQRLSLAQKAKIRPHVLVMTATPIPRTLAMTAYGDLDVSVVDELPPGRTPVQTQWLQPGAREEAYEAIRREIKAGRQAYVIYALVEESDKAERRAATQMAEHLSKDIFPDFRVELLHGRMKPDEKDAVMARFKSGESQLLCSTTVIEVGVDVPNATLMMIEDADRFGLAQLHQLRGRVGRGADRSYCYLVAKAGTEDGKKRLEAMVRSTDGFEIAEEDLRLRGPGEILGIRQSGLPDFKLANLISDQKTLLTAKAQADALIEGDPGLRAPQHRELAALVKRRIEKKLELGEVA